jgi:hypothetical protein
VLVTIIVNFNNAYPGNHRACSGASQSTDSVKESNYPCQAVFEKAPTAGFGYNPGSSMTRIPDDFI